MSQLTRQWGPTLVDVTMPLRQYEQQRSALWIGGAVTKAEIRRTMSCEGEFTTIKPLSPLPDGKGQDLYRTVHEWVK